MPTDNNDQLREQLIREARTAAELMEKALEEFDRVEKHARATVERYRAGLQICAHCLEPRFCTEVQYGERQITMGVILPTVHTVATVLTLCDECRHNAHNCALDVV